MIGGRDLPEGPRAVPSEAELGKLHAAKRSGEAAEELDDQAPPVARTVTKPCASPSRGPVPLRPTLLLDESVQRESGEFSGEDLGCADECGAARRYSTMTNPPTQISRLELAFITGLGTGYLRPASGTWGSLPPVLLAVALAAIGMDGRGIDAAVARAGIVFAASCLISGERAEVHFGQKDPSLSSLTRLRDRHSPCFGSHGKPECLSATS